MKTIGMVYLLLSFAIPETWADTVTSTGQGTLPPDTAYTVVDRGANHRVWEKTTYEPGPKGVAVPKKHRYTELATGMHYLKNGQWVESKEVIEPFKTGAIARQGQYQVIFANNLNSYAAIDQQTPDGKRIRSNILGLEYYDTATGTSALVAQVQDSQGQLIASNQVTYFNAFQGLKADVTYTYKRGSFEQDVILREQPPTPEAYGLNSATTVLEVLTEFINPPKAQLLTHHQKNGAGVDNDVSWGAMGIGRGKAFELGDKPKARNRVMVTKQYFKAQGRQFLLEEVPLVSIKSSLSALPQQSSRKSKLPTTASKTRTWPHPLLAQVGQQPMKLASTAPSNKGYVLDYVAIDVDQADTTFQGDTTYLVTGNIYLSGNTVFEGGTVIKYGDDDSNPSITEFSGSITCKTGPYRPAIFTSRNDDTVGENLNDGGPVAFFQALAEGGADGDQLSYVRVSYANTGVHTYNINLNDSQFVNCQYPIEDEWGTCNMTNVLMVNVGTAFYGTDYTVNGYHLTVDGCTDGQLCEDWSGSSGNTVSLVNSLLVNVGDDGNATITTDHTARVAGSSSDYFQTAGGGAHYLAVGSPYRGAGTSAIDSGTLADIATKTTWPPTVYNVPGGYFSENLNLYPSVASDTNAFPDLGYHYDRLDYVLGGMFVTNATITVNPGTAIGIYATNGVNYGLSIADSAHLNCQGLAGSPVHLAEYNTVQELVPSGWQIPSYGLVAHLTGFNCSMQFNFVDWSVFAQDVHHVQFTGLAQPVNYNNCEFYNGQMYSGGTLNFTNCLFVRDNSDFEFSDTNQSFFCNNTLVGGAFLFVPSQTNAVLQNNLFDGTSVPDNIGVFGLTYIGGHNAYVTNCDMLDPVMPGDRVLTNSPAYQTSWFGNYYLPPDSPLINAGSTTADQVGLYHFTTQTNQTVEGTSVVDIGYHYVATDAYGNPLDTNGDGIPDYIEDGNGHGVFDTGDFGDWKISPYGLGGANGLQVFTPLK